MYNNQHSRQHDRLRERRGQRLPTPHRYTDQIFRHGVYGAKYLYVKALRQIRTQHGFTPEQVDKITKLSIEWPTTRQVERDCRCFTFAYHQALVKASLDDNPFVGVSRFVGREIQGYLLMPGVLDHVLSDLASRDFSIEMEITLMVQGDSYTISKEVIRRVAAQSFLSFCVLEEVGNRIVV